MKDKRKCTYCIQYKCEVPPRTGCTVCWDKWFGSRPGAVAAIWQYIETYGTDSTDAKIGSKVVKQLVRYMKNRKA